MVFYKRFTLIIFLFILCIFTYFLVFQQPSRNIQNSQKVVSPNKSKQNKVDFKNTQLVSLDNQGKKIFSLTSSKLVLTNENKVHYENVKGIFYAKDKPSFTFKCNLAIYNLKTKDINLSGNIFLNSAQNQANLQGKNIFYFQKKKKLFSKQNFKFTKKNITITANSFVADLALKKISFLGNTKSEIVF